jgi:nitrogen fixation protein FixH
LTSIVMAKEITGRHVLFAMVGFFAIIIATDAYLVYKAVSTFGGIETDDAYRKGLGYNQRIAEERAQAELGWTKTASLEKDSGDLVVTIRDRYEKGVDGLAITALVGRPATNAEDRTLALTPVGSGRYSAGAGALEPGTWVATVTARKAGADDDAIVYQSKVRLWKAP